MPFTYTVKTFVVAAEVFKCIPTYQITNIGG